MEFGRMGLIKRRLAQRLGEHFPEQRKDCPGACHSTSRRPSAKTARHPSNHGGVNVILMQHRNNRGGLIQTIPADGRTSSDLTRFIAALGVPLLPANCVGARNAK
jgi:hypothetical protein